MEPLYNGQVGAGAFVHYLEVSFIGRCGCGLSLKIDDAIYPMTSQVRHMAVLNRDLVGLAYLYPLYFFLLFV